MYVYIKLSYDSSLSHETDDDDDMGARGDQREISLTMKFGHIDAKLISLFQHMLTTLCDELVKSVGEARHAISQVIEAEIDAGEGISHGRRLR